MRLFFLSHGDKARVRFLKLKFELGCHILRFVFWSKQAVCETFWLLISKKTRPSCLSQRALSIGIPFDPDLDSYGLKKNKTNIHVGSSDLFRNPSNSTLKKKKKKKHTIFLKIVVHRIVESRESEEREGRRIAGG
jgi:hypothetical protein